MYHTRLHCYVAIELKVVEFQPEFISKLNYYISAIDDLVKMPEDNPTIGFLLCRSKNTCDFQGDFFVFFCLKRLFCHLCIKNFAKIICNTENFSNFVPGNHSEIL